MGLVIGLGHKARNGKDSFARFIQEEYGSKYDIRTYSFAKALKDEVNELYEKNECWQGAFADINSQVEGGLPDWVVIEHNPDMTDPLCLYGKQRYLLQFLGMYRRSQSKMYWVHKLDKVIKAEKPLIAIVTDVRFKTEKWWLESFGNDAISVKVERKDFDNGLNHVSETELDKTEWDYVIQAGSIEELKRDAHDFFEMIIARQEMPEEFKTEPEGFWTGE